MHQDAMAPMALLELWEACGDERYLDAVDRGLKWIYGANERRADMVDRESQLVSRSIRRRPVARGTFLGVNTGSLSQARPHVTPPPS